DNVDKPLDARKVDAPLLAIARRNGQSACILGQFFPWKGELDGPSFVGVLGVVEGAVHEDGGFEAGQVRAEMGGTAVAIGAVQGALAQAGSSPLPSMVGGDGAR